MGLIEVTSDKFYEVIGPLDVKVHSHFEGKVQHCDFKLKGTLVGRISTDRTTPGSRKTAYLLRKENATTI